MDCFGRAKWIINSISNPDQPGRNLMYQSYRIAKVLRRGHVSYFSVTVIVIFTVTKISSSTVHSYRINIA